MHLVQSTNIELPRLVHCFFVFVEQIAEVLGPVPCSVTSNAGAKIMCITCMHMLQRLSRGGLFVARICGNRAVMA